VRPFVGSKHHDHHPELRIVGDLDVVVVEYFGPL
jgi:hypothetical protein